MILDGTTAGVVLDLLDIVGDDPPPSGFVTVLAIRGGAEVTWTTKTKHHVVRTNVIQFLPYPDHPEWPPEFFSVEWEEGDDIPRLTRELEDRRECWLPDRVYVQRYSLDLDL